MDRSSLYQSIVYRVKNNVLEAVNVTILGYADGKESSKVIIESKDLNENTFNENDWKELYSLSKETFVDESEELKKTAAGAGFTDND